MELVTYNAARHALTQCVEVDDVKQVLDKSVALEAYAKQVNDIDMECWVTEIKLRARRRLGEISKELDKAPSGRASVSHCSGAKSKIKALKNAGVESTLAHRCEKIADIDESDFEERIAVLKEKKIPPTVKMIEDLIKKKYKEAKREQDKKALALAQETITDEKRKRIESVCDLRICSCRELFSSGINPDAVITDPPYPKEFLPVFSELSEACADALVPLVAVMSGQSYLPEVMNRLCEHLTYRWTIAYLTPGGQSVQQFPAKVNTFWKPVLLFGSAQDWIGDVTRSNVNDNDKRHHEWGQSESGIADLVERLTKPGQTICDPFLGGGTTAVVSLALGRRFIGCDINETYVTNTRQRIEAVQ